MRLIQETDASENSFVSRWPRRGFGELRPGAVVAVDPGRVAVLLGEAPIDGLPAVVESGRREWAGTTPISAAVVFLSGQPAMFLWGTAEPLMVGDAGWRGHGTLRVRVTDPLRVAAALVESRGLATTEGVERHLRAVVVGTLAETLSRSAPGPEAPAIAAILRAELAPKLAALGLELVDLAVGGLERRG